MLRPKNAPIRIPLWAWARDKWLSTSPDKRGAKPGPAKLPIWFWPWRVWLHSKHRKPAPPAPQPITMYDSINIDQIPADAAAVAGYVNGRWPTFPSLVKRFPHAEKLSIAVTSAVNADCLDVEKGDAEPWEAPIWVKRQLARGVKLPVVYTSVSEAPAVLAALKAKGIERNQIRLWTAHYTGKPHRCSSSCADGFTGLADATQYDDHALGRSLDVSLVAPGFFNGNL